MKKPKFTILYLASLFLFAIILVVSAATLSVHAQEATYIGTPTDTPKAAANDRYLANKVSGSDFSGYVDAWASSDANTFATNMSVTGGQAWPRITEGTTNPGGSEPTPGFGLSVDDYINGGNHYVTYNGEWSAMDEDIKHSSVDDDPNTKDRGPSGKRYNGSYIWTNNADNLDSNGKPQWPYTTEINIWNRGKDIPSGTTPFADYYDGDNTYKVSGKQEPVPGVPFYAYYFILQDKKSDDMEINTTEVLKHLRDTVSCTGKENCKELDGREKLIEISVAAEGHANAKGKFIANIQNMGRP